MANVITASGHSITGIIDADDTQTAAITVRGARLVDLSLDFGSGTFVGTVNVQRKTSSDASGGTAIAAQWVTIESHTASVEKVLQNATTREMRLDVDVTSGDLGFELTAGNKDG